MEFTIKKVLEVSTEHSYTEFSEGDDFTVWTKDDCCFGGTIEEVFEDRIIYTDEDNISGCIVYFKNIEDIDFN